MDHQTEIYFIIYKALQDGPFSELAESMRDKLQEQLKPERYNYLGNKVPSDLENILAKYPQLNSKTLWKICQNLKANLDKYVPPIRNIQSLLGDGRHSLIRSEKSLIDDDLQYAAKALFSRRHYYPAFSKQDPNMFNYLRMSRVRGPVCIRRSLPVQLYSRISLCKRLMGHLSAVYCVCFDQTGQYVLTGADDHLIKIWSALDGRLIRTLRGHHGQITDMCVNYENRLLASAGMDKVIRIWDLKTGKLLECLCAQTATITSVKFGPYNRQGNEKWLISTSNDGSIVFWSYDDNEPIRFKKVKKLCERRRPGGQLTCSSFSTGGSFLACGSSDHFIHIYGFKPECSPHEIYEIEAHADKVDSIQFCNEGHRFISGSKDGTAIIWNFRRGHWEQLKLDMNTQLDQTVPPNSQGRPTVLIVQWSRDDRYVMTSIVDYSIKIWDSRTGRLLHILKEHKHDVYLLESHPTDPRVFISASHDGTLVIWDIDRGKAIKKFHTPVDPSDAPELRTAASIYDIKYSPDGNMFAATDSHGYLSLYSASGESRYAAIPNEMFFHTDYRPLIRDLNFFVLDEQSHLAPHLMPKPTLVDMQGNPYPPAYQRLVPEGEVVKPLTPTQLKSIVDVIESHNKLEYESFLYEKRSPPDDPQPCGSHSGHFNESSRYNTRYNTRSTFACARISFQVSAPGGRPQRKRPTPRYQEEPDDDEDDQQQEEEEEEEDTEIASDDDETIVDSDDTEIYNYNLPRRLYSLRQRRKPKRFRSM